MGVNESLAIALTDIFGNNGPMSSHRLRAMAIKCLEKMQGPTDDVFKCCQEALKDSFNNVRQAAHGILPGLVAVSDSNAKDVIYLIKGTADEAETYSVTISAIQACGSAASATDDTS